jgi:hypothetical protein
MFEAMVQRVQPEGERGSELVRERTEVNRDARRQRDTRHVTVGMFTFTTRVVHKSTSPLLGSIVVPVPPLFLSLLLVYSRPAKASAI